MNVVRTLGMCVCVRACNRKIGGERNRERNREIGNETKYLLVFKRAH